MTEKEFFADNLYSLANKIFGSDMTEAECRKKNVTDIYRYEISQRVKNGELVNININGTVRKGKSTVAISECARIKKEIEQHHHIKRPLTQKNICRDQNEYSRTVKNRPNDYKHECDVIDEWAEMEEAGYNATIESKYLRDFSDRQAGRYYHRIACSPSNITDPNTDILIEIIAVNKQTHKSLGLLYFRRHNIQAILLGHVEFDVSNILETPFYKEYLRKKEQKWELMNKHNIMSPRELEYAIIIIKTYETIKETAKYGLTSKKLFKETLRDEADKRGVWFSILGDKDVLETLEGFTELTHTIYMLEGKIERLQQKNDPSPHTTETLTAWTNSLGTMKRQLGTMLERQHRRAKLWEDYQRIEQEGHT